MSTETVVLDQRNDSHRTGTWAVGALLLTGVLSFAVFGRSANYGYLPWDDYENIVRNANVADHSLSGLRRIWTATYDGLYIPVTYTTWWLEKVAGLGSRASHLINVLLHALTSWTVFLVARELLERCGNSLRWSNLACLSAALIFCAHPLQTEPVVWSTGRKDLLAGLFSMLALWNYVAAESSRRWYGASLLMFVCAVFSKPAAVALPVAILVIDWLVLRVELRRAFLRVAPFAVVALVGAVVSYSAQRTAAAGANLFGDAHLAWKERPLAVGDAFAFYGSKLIIPTGLSPVYDRPMVPAAKDVMWALMGLVLALGLLVIALVTRRGIAVVSSAALLMLLPVSGIVPFHYRAISTVADRYMYVTMAVAAIAYSFAFNIALQKGPLFRSAAMTLTLLVLTAYATLAYRQTAYWRDSLTLWSRAVKMAPENAVARSNLAMSLAEAGRSDEAIVHLEHAVRLKPGFAMAQNNLAAAYEQQGKRDKALEHYEAAVRANPALGPAQAGLAAAYFQMQRPDDAARAAQAALKSMPDHFTSLAILASVLGNQGKVTEALELLRGAAARNPRDEQIVQLLAQAESIARGQ